MFGKKKDERSLVERKVEALARFLNLTFTRKEDTQYKNRDQYNHIPDDFDDGEIEPYDDPLTTLKKLVKLFKEKETKPKK